MDNESEGEKQEQEKQEEEEQQQANKASKQEAVAHAIQSANSDKVEFIYVSQFLKSNTYTLPPSSGKEPCPSDFRIAPGERYSLSVHPHLQSAQQSTTPRLSMLPLHAHKRSTFPISALAANIVDEEVLHNTKLLRVKALCCGNCGGGGNSALWTGRGGRSW